MSDNNPIATVPAPRYAVPAGRALARVRELRDDLARRRTIRDFSDRPVPMELVETAIAAAATAPSGANLQPWRFVGVTDPERRRRIRAAAETEEREFYRHRATEEWLTALAPLQCQLGPLDRSAPLALRLAGGPRSAAFARWAPTGASRSCRPHRC